MPASVASPVVIARGGDGAVLIVAEADAAYPLSERVPAQIWDPRAGYSQVLMLAIWLKFNPYWELLARPVPWSEP